ncbi:MAG: hypothetical protein JO281_16010 [Pseudonocardiales bacterium]|nr:hypothetical protein [Pseudonocardiales bacterium]
MVFARALVDECGGVGASRGCIGQLSGLVSCLAAAAAIALVAGPLGAAWLWVAGVIVAAVGALVRVVIAVQRARLEGKREKAEFGGRLRVAVAPIGEVNPTLVGVDPAAQTILSGGVVPDYVGRAADEAVRKAVAAALDGSGPWLLVVVGDSKVGKSRTLFEALHRGCEAYDYVIRLVRDKPGMKRTNLGLSS